VSRKQWRLLNSYLEMFDDGAERANWCEYTRSELVELLAVDYDALPEKSFDPKATPRDMNGLAQVACACGCGTLFTSKGSYHKYCDPSHRKSKPKKIELTAARKVAPKDYALVAGMLILVDPALDHYETREMCVDLAR
jgi:hypothetical protein